MAIISSKLIRFVPLGGVLALGAMAGMFGMSSSLSAQAQGEEPIAYIGHGAFFERDGKQIVPTAEWVAKAQDWYRAKLSRSLDSKGKAAFATFDRRLSTIKAEGQARLIVRQRSLEWLIVNAPRAAADNRTIGKINAIGYELNFRLPVPGVQPKQDGGLYQLDPEVARMLDSPEFRVGAKRGGGAGSAMLADAVNALLLPTTNEGQPYIDQCTDAANDVPKPPTINVMDTNGTAGWKIEGSIPPADQFITGTPAEIRSFTSSKGVCIALPRYTDNSKTVVKLDGVICLSRTTSKVCIWDNQKFDPVTMKPKGFNFGATEQIPIGVANLGINPSGKFQAGGAGLENGTGGVCTDCHAGENPYIIHPLVTIAPGKTMADLRTTLPMMPPQRYDPIVAASWPQNDLSHAEPLVPGACVGCHRQGPTRAGRFPHLSTALNGTLQDPSGYCNTILKQAVERTMPQGAPPGSSLSDPEVIDFRNWCLEPGTGNPNGGSDRGDPHLSTVNAVNYDFQPAGEFTALRNSATGFELQTRQTPVTTTFIPNPNPYTGLQSCVSLNTAAAVRLGRHRVSYQSTGERTLLRVDGKVTTIPSKGIDLGGGNRIVTPASGSGVSAYAADGTRVVITPIFWSSQGYWYLDVEVTNSPAREGLMGHILAGQWLPLGPTGTRFGAAPGTIPARDLLLNQTFANAWRVTPATSMFDYAPGTSTATFTDPAWPHVGTLCSATTVPSIPGPGKPTIRPIPRERAEQLCSKFKGNKAAFNECVFDTMVMGDPNVPAGYAKTIAARTAMP
ncbi:hypothetical protein OF829_18590 [Sphingomonas sp. LB-2]|uniref:hypothetical protein n=1 Tax=Sphingomonas caeni TaxID=2984949 RepID=UPI00223233A9|nr:hypothetical protein [Sphingomonas caeni]MCW3849251.1 hypothetical protein [Sphingomonas caeni]